MLEGGASHGSCKDVFQWISVCLGSKVSGKTSLVFYFIFFNKHLPKRKPNEYYIFITFCCSIRSVHALI